MLEFKIDSENPQLLRIAIAYDFFFENYGAFLDTAVADSKTTDTEIADRMEALMDLSFSIGDLFLAKADLIDTEGNELIQSV